VYTVQHRKHIAWISLFMQTGTFWRLEYNLLCVRVDFFR